MRVSSTSMTMQLDAVGDVRRRFDDLEQRPQQAADDVRGAGNHAVGLVHRQHHRAVIIRLEHRLARLVGAQPLFAAQRMKALGEILQILALGGIDDADAVERNVQAPARRPSPWPRRRARWARPAAARKTAARPAKCAAPRLPGKTTRFGCRCNFSMTLPMKRMGVVSGFRFQVSSFKIAAKLLLVLRPRPRFYFSRMRMLAKRAYLATAAAGNLNSALRDKHLSVTLTPVRRIGKVPPCRRLTGQSMVNKSQKMKGQRTRDCR